LRQLRKRLADQAGVPPYVVFPDRTLREMARAEPSSVEDLEGIFGVGAHKAERYGAQFVAEIRRTKEDA
jgi:ATP-dependent DNA helicase RecQ